MDRSRAWGCGVVAHSCCNAQLMRICATTRRINSSVTTAPTHAHLTSHTMDSEGEITPQCGCCWAGRLCFRLLYVCFWVVVALPFRCLETLFLGVVGEYIRAQLLQDEVGVKAYFIFGLFVSYAVFLPLARLEAVHSGALCTSYLTTLAWILGNVCMNIFIYTDVIKRLKIGGVCQAVVRGKCRLVTPTPPGYLGMGLGIAFAFPVAAMHNVDPTMSAPGFSEWCRPSPGVPAEYIYVPVFIVAMLAANVDTTPQRSTKPTLQSTHTERPPLDQYHGTIAGIPGEVDLDQLLEGEMSTFMDEL